jgi:hypothetical protein
MCALKNAFDADNIGALIFKIIKDEPKPVRNNGVTTV